MLTVVDSLLSICRWFREYATPGNGTDNGFNENQKARDEERREDQIPTGFRSADLRPPLGVGAVDDSGYEQNRRGDTGKRVEDLDEYRSYFGVEPLGVVGEYTETGHHAGDDESGETELSVGGDEVFLALFVLVDDYDDQTDYQESETDPVKDPVEGNATGTSKFLRSVGFAIDRVDCFGS